MMMMMMARWWERWSFFCMLLTAGPSRVSRVRLTHLSWKSCLKSCHVHSGLSFLLPHRGNFWALKSNLHVLKVLYSSPPPPWRHVRLFPVYLTATSEPLLHFIRNVFKGGHRKAETPSKAGKCPPPKCHKLQHKVDAFWQKFRHKPESKKEIK